MDGARRLTGRSDRNGRDLTMVDTSNARARVRAIRGSARERLLELRAERRARRAGATSMESLATHESADDYDVAISQGRNQDEAEISSETVAEPSQLEEASRVADDATDALDLTEKDGAAAVDPVHQPIA